MSHDYICVSIIIRAHLSPTISERDWPKYLNVFRFNSRRQSRGARQLFSFNLVGVVVAMGVRDWPTMSLTPGRKVRHEKAPSMSLPSCPTFLHGQASFVCQFPRINSPHLRRARETGRGTSKGRNPRRRLSIEGCATERGSLSSSMPSVGIVIDWKPVIQLVPR